MIKEKIYPYLLAFVQLGCLAFLGLSAPVIARNTTGLLLESIGIFTGLYAVFTAGVHNVNITPTPKNGGILITKGPYKWVRHPMYFAQIIALTPLVNDYYTPWRLGVFILLIITLLIKIPYEEKGLIRQFGRQYENYMKQTKKILPFIY